MNKLFFYFILNLFWQYIWTKPWYTLLIIKIFQITIQIALYLGHMTIKRSLIKGYNVRELLFVMCFARCFSRTLIFGEVRQNRGQNMWDMSNMNYYVLNDTGSDATSAPEHDIFTPGEIRNRCLFVAFCLHRDKYTERVCTSIRHSADECFVGNIYAWKKLLHILWKYE